VAGLSGFPAGSRSGDSRAFASGDEKDGGHSRSFQADLQSVKEEQ